MEFHRGIRKHGLESSSEPVIKDIVIVSRRACSRLMCQKTNKYIGRRADAAPHRVRLT